VTPGTCSRGCGKPTHRGNCKGRVQVPFPKAAAAKLSAADAERMVAEAREITAQVQDEVRQRAPVLSKDAEGETGEPMSTPLRTAAKDIPYDSAWGWVELSAVPEYRTRSVYDDAVARLRETPAGKAMTRTFANPDIAGTFVKGIYRRGKDIGLAVASQQDGETVYLWRKA
jgi:hypothetical protein